MKFSMITMILSLTLLASCNGGSGGSNDNKSQSTLESNPPANSVSSTQPGSESLNLVFISDCKYDSDTQLYLRSSIKVKKQDDDTEIVAIDSFSSDKNCAFLQMTIEFPLESIIQENKSVYSGYADKVLFRPRSQAMVEELRKNSMCETDNWNLGVANDVTGTSCIETGMNSKVSVNISKSSAAVTICDLNENTCETRTLKKK